MADEDTYIYNHNAQGDWTVNINSNRFKGRIIAWTLSTGRLKHILRWLNFYFSCCHKLNMDYLFLFVTFVNDSIAVFLENISYTGLNQGEILYMKFFLMWFSLEINYYYLTVLNGIFEASYNTKNYSAMEIIRRGKGRVVCCNPAWFRIIGMTMTGKNTFFDKFFAKPRVSYLIV